MYAIELKNVSVHYDDVCALKNIHLKIKKNDFAGIIGPNGGGKTTLIKAILGLNKEYQGEIMISDDVTMGYVPQFTHFNKAFPINVNDVILTGCLDSKIRLFHRYSQKERQRVDNILKKLHIEALKDRQIGKLSGGQIQKVLIARAMATGANCLVLDEPTASLDAEAKSEIYELLKEMNKDTTIITITHDIGVISAYVKSVSCLNQELFYHGAPEHLGSNLEKAYGCPIDLIAHGVPHRVFHEHQEVPDVK